MTEPALPSDAVPLLGPADAPAWRAVNPGGRAPVLLVCDHASNRIPTALGTLGLPPAELERHIAWDIGAAAVTERLAGLLDAPALLSGYSRLVLDCNRHPGGAGSIPAESDGVAVPGNRDLSEAAVAARVAALFQPYQQAIADRLAAFARAGTAPALVSIHSFTPAMNGVPRPWHVGILWDEDPRIARPLLDALGADARLVVGDNEPYSARQPHGYTTAVHGTRTGLPHVLIEIRQDLIAEEAGQAEWAARLALALKPILADPKLYAVRQSERIDGSDPMDDRTRTELEAAAFRHLVQHLRERTDVQNIDLMNLAGFCRNCLSKWYRAAAEERGVAISDPAAREVVYGMPYEEWKAKYQKEASVEQKKAFDQGHQGH